MTAWNDTPEGAAANAAFENLRATYTSYLPLFLDSLRVYANRPITG